MIARLAQHVLSAVLSFILICAGSAALAFVLMVSWNVAVTHAFALPPLNWLQSFGLLVVSALLFTKGSISTQVTPRAGGQP